MRGLTSTVGGLALLGLALWQFSRGDSNVTVLVLGAGALILLYRGYQGLTLDEAAGDAMMSMEFVRNPAGAVLDFATDRAEQWIGEVKDKPPADTEERGFDPEAILAAYMEKRAENSPASPDPASSPPRGFGRKGL